MLGIGNHFGWHDDIMMEKDPWKTRKIVNDDRNVKSSWMIMRGENLEFAALRSGKVTTSEVLS